MTDPWIPALPEQGQRAGARGWPASMATPTNSSGHHVPHPYPFRADAESGRIFSFVLALVLCSVSTIAFATYPDKPIRMLTSEAGGGSDFVARLVAQGMGAHLGQRVVVDNRGMIAAEIAKYAAPDGYTLLLYGSPLWLSPFLREKLPYDPVRDYAPVSLVVSTPNVMVVHPGVAAQTVGEFIALAKTRPGMLNYSSASTGSTQHLAAELFKNMAGLNIVRIPYKGSAADVSEHRLGHTTRQGRTTARARRHHCSALGLVARSADRRRLRITRLRIDLALWRLCAGQHTAGDHRPPQP